MISGDFRTTRRPRAGFTLVETLLVLVVLALITGMAWPSLQGAMKSSRLRRSADKIRGEWGAARLEAMASGRIMAFYYELGGSQFRIDPLYTDDEWENSQASQLPPLTEGAGKELRGRRVLGQLIDGVEFYEEDASNVDERIATALDSERVVAAQDQVTWGQPILFYPDGSATDSYLTLVNSDEDSADRVGVMISLRGVTGSARVTPPSSLSRLPL